MTHPIPFTQFFRHALGTAFDPVNWLGAGSPLLTIAHFIHPNFIQYVMNNRHPIPPTPRRASFWTALILLYGALAAIISAQTPAPGKFIWDVPGDDTYADTALVDLRHLNENYAGEHGWIQQEGHRFIHSDNGQPVRFWTINASVLSDINDARQQTKFWAKRGVNMVRWHSNVWDNKAATLDTVDMERVDACQRQVQACKEAGIYTFLSYFFVLNLRIQAGWGIDGYDESWIENNTDPSPAEGFAEKAPFGLMFFDAKFKAAMKKWIATILTTPSPYNGGKQLKDEKAIAIIETLNEDNLFFNTWEPNRFPTIQRERMNKKFGDFLKVKYGSVQAAFDSWGPLNSNNVTNYYYMDDIPNGEVTVTSAFTMTRVGVTGTADNKRIADLIEFLGRTQRDFFIEFKDYVRGLGYGGTMTASNWKTAEIRYLADLESYTYTGAGVIDKHNYYGTGLISRAISNSVGGGDTWINIPAVNWPRGSPAIYKQVAGHPSFISETCWNSPTEMRAESSLYLATYGALNDQDGICLFSTGSPTWASGSSVWTIACPGIMGTFPAAALIYRQGYVAEAPTVVLENRSLQSIYTKQDSIYYFPTGYDPTRDPESIFDYKPGTAKGIVDLAAAMVGKVEIAFQSDPHFVHPRLKNFLDNPSRTVSSITGELLLNWGEVPGRELSGGVLTEALGHLVINAPRAQGVMGWTDAAGPIQTDNAVLRLENEFGSLVIVPLDGQPISQSSRLLIQTMTKDTLTGYAALTKSTIWPTNGKRYQAREIVTLGERPWQVDKIVGSVSLKGIGTVTAVRNADSNGYFTVNNTSGRMFGGAYKIDLSEDAAYTIVDITPPADKKPVFATKALPNGQKNAPFSHRLEVLSGDGTLSFSAPTLPEGMTLSADGKIEGTPVLGGSYTVEATVTDADGDSSTRSLPLVIFPIDDKPPCESVLAAPFTTDLTGGFKWNSPLGFLYDNFYPFVWSYSYAGWIYIFGCHPTANETDGYFLYDFKNGQFGFTGTAYYPNYYIMGGSLEGQPVSLTP